MLNKIYLIRDNKDAAIAALNSYLDRIYSLTDDYFEDGKLKEGLTPDEKIEKFVLELREDASKYEKVRRKLIDNDFNLSLVEINYIALAFVYIVQRWKNEQKMILNAINQTQDIIAVLMAKQPVFSETETEPNVVINKNISE